MAEAADIPETVDEEYKQVEDSPRDTVEKDATLDNLEEAVTKEDPSNPTGLPDKWVTTEKKFVRACDQIMLLSRNLNEMEHRFQVGNIFPHIFLGVLPCTFPGSCTHFYPFADFNIQS